VPGLTIFPAAPNIEMAAMFGGAIPIFAKTLEAMAKKSSRKS